MAAIDTLFAEEGDTLDALLWRERALGPAAIAPVMDANTGLAGIGTILPAGTPVIVPASAPTATTLATINLWN